jgi:GTP-binding protein EngB required for normal cell division
VNEAVLRRIVDELLMLVHESAGFHSEKKVRGVFEEAARHLVALRRRVALIGQRYVVAVVGLTNVGKSTLLNALMGVPLTPRRNRPCTSAPIEFSYGESLHIAVHYEQSIQRGVWNCPTAEAAYERLERLTDEPAEAGGRDISRIVVEAPLPLLANGLVLADTPGFGAAQAGNAAGQHEATLMRYLKEDVSQVFWVVLAEQGIGQREMSFHDRFFSEVCDDVVVTGCDDWDTRDKQRFRQRFSVSFGSRMPRFHFVSGLLGMRARQAADESALDAAGIPLLEDRIRELSGGAGRLTAVVESAVQLACDLHYWLAHYRDMRHRKLTNWWRPDSWSRWSACYPESRIKRRITRGLEAGE